MGKKLYKSIKGKVALVCGAGSVGDGIGNGRAISARNKDGHVDGKSMSKQVGDRQVLFKKSRDGNLRQPMVHRRHDNTLALGDSKHGAWMPHDLRRTGVTMMQGLGISLDIIDRCQNHVLAGSRVRRHYLHHDYAEEKRAAWQQLGERMSLILSPPGNVVQTTRK